MTSPFYVVRRELAMEMNLWGGKVDGQSPGPAVFSSVDAQNSLFVVYDNIRPEPDEAWSGSYICINPGGTGNVNLPTIWRRIADDQGFINSTGAMTLTSALPSGAYALTTMTYELFKTFTPEQWLKAINYSLRTSYPQRHRVVAFEAYEDPDTVFYDWGHLASELAMINPVSAPTVTAVADPKGRTNNWQSGTYTIAYSYFNAAGETLISPTTTLALSPTQVLQFAAITVPEQGLGVNYFCSQDPGGTLLSQLTTGSGLLVDVGAVNAGHADPNTAIVPKVNFWGPPSEVARVIPAFNTTGLDMGGLSLKTIRRRTNPGQYPERYLDLNPQWWREVGGTTVKLESKSSGTALRFECMAPVRMLSGESDATEEPLELMIAGGMLYLWNLQSMTGSSQNTTIWQAESKMAENRFTKARNLYQMPGPRKTMRRPYIFVARWLGGGW